MIVRTVNAVIGGLSILKRTRKLKYFKDFLGIQRQCWRRTGYSQLCIDITETNRRSRFDIFFGCPHLDLVRLATMLFPIQMAVAGIQEGLCCQSENTDDVPMQAKDSLLGRMVAIEKLPGSAPTFPQAFLLPEH
jgi:hypothetical protein